MNWVDVLILGLLGLAVYMGLRAGILELFLSVSGLILGLFIGSRLAELIVVHFSSQFIRFMTIVVLELGLASSLWIGGLVLSRRLKPRASRLLVSKFNEVAGGVIDLFLILGICWLVASGLSNIGSYGIGRGVRDSLIISKLDNVLPNPPDTFAALEKIVSPNDFPSVFLGLEPAHTTISPYNTVNNAAVLAAEQSVVKVQGFNCGSAIYGSGFVAAKGLVVTNAHVVAGMMRPQVVDSHGTHHSVPVLFDPQLDIAVLRVDNLDDAPLALYNKILPRASGAATLGFPQGGELNAEDAVILDHTTAVGRDIYGKGQISRQIYEVQADVQEGDSGGPLLATNGQVAGIVFARSISQNDVGYALMSGRIGSIIDTAGQQRAAVDTGYCTNG